MARAAGGAGLRRSAGPLALGVAEGDVDGSADGGRVTGAAVGANEGQADGAALGPGVTAVGERSGQLTLAQITEECTLGSL